MKVILPQTAVDTLNEIISENKDKPKKIRIYFAGFGCSGASFGIALDEQNESDVEYNIDGLHFIMNKDEYDQYGDVTITDTGYGFVISVKNMPQGEGNCGGGCSGCSC